LASKVAETLRPLNKGSREVNSNNVDEDADAKVSEEEEVADQGRERGREESEEESAKRRRFMEDAEEKDDKIVTAAVINQGGMPTSVQSAPGTLC
jgi:hypothetical protein